jgi:[histone H3]-lysine9 N-trimethyltransferase SUV39H
MRQRAQTTGTREADEYIRHEFQRIAKDYVDRCVQEYADNPKDFRGNPKLTAVNHVDGSSPPLSYEWNPSYKLQEGVQAQDKAALTSCVKKCRPHMGQKKGCEYSRDCECQEYARIEEKRLTPAQWERYNAGDTTDMPKWFPYGTYNHLLVKQYLNYRYPIYECNEGCKCGNVCKTRVVQFGRQVPLEIFKTSDGRGWGLRCTEALKSGQFIDYYFGEVITNEEADKREQSGKGKESYLFSLDKFADVLDDEQRENMYVVDGQFKGGPTRFINHSCDPNCRQYVVSFNKNDPFLYNLTIFAVKAIPAGMELTFDYLDADSTEEMPASQKQKTQEVKEDSIPCLCGARNCRKWLWK